MTKVIVFANQKGGVAKTTTAIALAQSLALDGKKVLFFDLDPQENASNTLRLKQDVPNLYDLMTAPDGDTSVFDACLQSVEGCKNITAIRGNIQLSAADLMFNRQGREFIIKERLEAHKSGFDVVIMDTPPALGVLTVNALTSAKSIAAIYNIVCADVVLMHLHLSAASYIVSREFGHQATFPSPVTKAYTNIRLGTRVGCSKLFCLQTLKVS